jgi:hypothetical protein
MVEPVTVAILHSEYWDARSPYQSCSLAACPCAAALEQLAFHHGMSVEGVQLYGKHTSSACPCSAHGCCCCADALW